MHSFIGYGWAFSAALSSGCVDTMRRCAFLRAARSPRACRDSAHRRPPGLDPPLIITPTSPVLPPAARRVSLASNIELVALRGDERVGPPPRAPLPRRGGRVRGLRRDARLLSIGVASAALKAGTPSSPARHAALPGLPLRSLPRSPHALTRHELLPPRRASELGGVLGVAAMTAGAYGLNGARGATPRWPPSGSGSAGKGGKIKAGAPSANEKVLEKAKEKASRDHLRGATARAAEDGAAAAAAAGPRNNRNRAGRGAGGLLASPPPGREPRRARGRRRRARPRGASRAAISSRGSLAFPAEPGSRSCPPRRSGA